MFFRIGRLCALCNSFIFLNIGVLFIFLSPDKLVLIFSIRICFFYSLSRNFRLHTLRLLSHPLSCIININRVRVAAIILPFIETFLVCFVVVKRFTENKKISKCNHIITTVLEREKIVYFFLQSSLHC